jgi:hypothetical protein
MPDIMQNNTTRVGIIQIPDEEEEKQALPLAAFLIPPQYVSSVLLPWSLVGPLVLLSCWPQSMHDFVPDSTAPLSTKPNRYQDSVESVLIPHGEPHMCGVCEHVRVRRHDSPIDPPTEQTPQA